MRRRETSRRRRVVEVSAAAKFASRTASSGRDHGLPMLVPLSPRVAPPTLPRRMRPPAPVAPLLAAARAFHRRVLGAVARARLDPDRAAREGVADLSFQIDELADGALMALGREVGAVCPTLLVAEGLGEKAFGRGTPRVRVLVDPIDGSRERTHRLGPAWALVGFASERSGGARARDLFLGFQGEIPLRESPTIRVLAARRGGGAWEEIRDAASGRLRSRRRYRADGKARPGAGFHVFAAF